MFIAPADGGPAADVISFSAATVQGLEGNTFFSPTVVDPFDVANAVRAMLVSKLRRLAAEGSADASALLALGDASSVDGQRTAAPLLSARGTALDSGAGVYLVSVSFPALLPGAPLPLPATALRSQLMNAVNDVSPDDPCASLAERTGFDVCNAIDDATHMTVSGARLLAVETAPGAEAAAGGAAQLLLPAGRRSRSSDTSNVRSQAALTKPTDYVDYISKIFGGIKPFGDAAGNAEVKQYAELAGSALGIFSAGYSLVSAIFGLARGPAPPDPTIT